MQFVSDPPIALKIDRMKQRARWQDAAIVDRQIDQTALVLEDDWADSPEFSFLVIGDSGSGTHYTHNPQRHIAERLFEHRSDCRFLLHTGDVVYLVGSSEYYFRNFIDPYREFLVGGDQAARLRYDQLVFNQPFLPVPGNHDYYDLPILYGVLSQLSLPIRYLFQSRIDLDVGWHGSEQGNTYARAFLDYLQAIPTQQLGAHLDRHYTAIGSQGRCLRYQPGSFTRLPNRYYTFRAGGLDFFALDSNTFNAPTPLASDFQGLLDRQVLEQQCREIEQQQQELSEKSLQLDPNQPDDAEQLDDMRAKLEHLAELERDLRKQLSADRAVTVDQEQLDWLQQRLIDSWHTEAVRGRVLYFHHPPYVTEATKWNQGQTLAIRHQLRRVLNNVAQAVGQRAAGRSIVDLVINGHAHCLEYLRTGDTGHGDAHTNWLICGGSGYSLRRQRDEGVHLTERRSSTTERQVVATSHLYIGRTGHGNQKHRPYSALRIDVRPGTPPRFVIRPIVSDRYQQQWLDQEESAIELLF